MFLIVGFLGCSQKSKKEDTLKNNPFEKSKNDNSELKSEKGEYSKYPSTNDTIIIILESGVTLKFGKTEFNNIIENYPELNSDYPQEPEESYCCNSNKDYFESEVGKDDYFILYAYFLKQKNGIEKNEEMRKKLIDIYQNINSLFQDLYSGGTFFMHQYLRIFAYAEYSIYLNSEDKDNFENKYDITKQKELYIKLLRQIIEDEIKIDGNTIGKEKIKKNEELNKIIDNLDKLITDISYLRRAQEFHFKYYQTF